MIVSLYSISGAICEAYYLPNKPINNFTKDKNMITTKCPIIKRDIPEDVQFECIVVKDTPTNSQIDELSKKIDAITDKLAKYHDIIMKHVSEKLELEEDVEESSTKNE
jgi:hypothetical protein